MTQREMKFAGTWLQPGQKRRLEALALHRGQTQSAVLRDLIAAAPLEGEPPAPQPRLRCAPARQEGLP